MEGHTLSLKTIAIGCDHSSESERALALAVKLARGLRSRVFIYHVLDLIAIEGWLFPSPGEGWFGSPPSLSATIEAYLEQGARTLKEKCEGILLREGVPGEFQILRGVVSEELLRITKNHDLILLGKKGEHARFHNRILGSVAERVARHGECPTLIVGEHPPEIRRILVGFDGSSLSYDALELSACFARSLSLDLHIAAVERSRTSAEKKLSLLENDPRLSTSKVTLHPLEGKIPYKALLFKAQEIGADLIAVGAHGEKGISRLWVGSTFTALLHESPLHLLSCRKAILDKEKR